ncbi:Hypothetical protein A7982_02017 [Minicystis rosea]|nr:Hypothetical protein A7982_02017 [Minicystis rosea]
MAAVRPESRRSFLSGLAGAVAVGAARPLHADSPAPADILASRTPPDFSVMDLTVEGDKKLANRFTLFIPNHLGKDERVPLLVLLHGLGETWDPTVGVFAWVERYGLGTAYARLRRPPIAHTSRQLNLLPDARIAELNTSLAAQPFRGMAIACPFTPNIGKLANAEAAYDAYASWIADVVVPRARKEAPVLADAAHTALDGVSLGGQVGIEVFIRRPEVFGVYGAVQGAFNTAKLSLYADKIAEAMTRTPRGAKPSIHLETSEADPFKETNLALSAMLTKKGVAHDRAVLVGLHDQVFLREAGALEMLLWHDRRMR